FCFGVILGPLGSALFPYATLFRSGFAVVEVVAPFADEAVVEAEGAHGVEFLAEGGVPGAQGAGVVGAEVVDVVQAEAAGAGHERSEEHTSELQSRENLVCRLLPEK